MGGNCLNDDSAWSSFGIEILDAARDGIGNENECETGAGISIILQRGWRRQ